MFQTGDHVTFTQDGYGRDAGSTIAGVVASITAGERPHVRIAQDDGRQTFGFVDLFRDLRKEG